MSLRVVKTPAKIRATPLPIHLISSLTIMGQPHATLPITITPRDHRVYIHSECGQATAVSGSDFNKLAYPYSFAVLTYCAGCGGVATLGYVRWQDTGETIANYRSRLANLTPAWVGWLPLWLPLLLAAIGGATGWLTGKGTEGDNFVTLIYAAVGAIFGGVMGFVLKPLIANHFIGAPWPHVD